MCVHTQSVSEEQKQLKGAGTRLTAEMISTAWVLSSSNDSGGASDVAEGWEREGLPSRPQSFSGTSREPPVFTSTAPGFESDIRPYTCKISEKLQAHVRSEFRCKAATET